MELPKSVILFNASEIIEIEFVKIPIISLETNNIVLKQIPKNDASSPCFFLTSSFEICQSSFNKAYYSTKNLKLKDYSLDFKASAM